MGNVNRWTTNGVERKSHLLGIFLVLIATIIANANAVYLGNLTQGVPPALLSFYYGLVAFLFFLLLRCRSLGVITANTRKSISDVIGLNVVTMGNWIGYIFALKYLEPAITVAIIVGTGPIFIILLGRYLRPHGRIYRGEQGSALGILFSLFLLVYLTHSGKTGIGPLSAIGFLIGIFGSITSGVAMAATTIYLKNLTEQGWKAFDIMIVRFFLLIFVAFLFCLQQSVSLRLEATQWPFVLLAAATGAIIPLSLFVVGLEKTEPITATILLATGPIFTLLFQFFDHRIIWSYHTLISILILITVVFLGSWVRVRTQNRPVDSPPVLT